MLRIDVERWRKRLAAVPWHELPVRIEDFVAALKGAVPELSDYIDKKFSRVVADENGGVELFVNLERHEDTGEQFAFEIAIAGKQGMPVVSPDHVHNQDEQFDTLAGEIMDKADDGTMIAHRQGMKPVLHGKDTRHQPVIMRFWVGWFYQSAGSRLADPEAASLKPATSVEVQTDVYRVAAYVLGKENAWHLSLRVINPEKMPLIAVLLKMLWGADVVIPKNIATVEALSSHLSWPRDRAPATA